MAVLLLNASFEPLRVIPLRRAIGLMVAEKVEVVAEGEGQLHSATLTLPVPAVLRLQYMVRVPRHATVPLSRQAVLVRDKRRCQFSHCTRSGSTVDHVIPKSRGGLHEWTNVVAACSTCNTRKGDRLLHELGWTLRSTPVAPRGPIVLLTAAGVAHPPVEWVDWLPGLAVVA